MNLLDIPIEMLGFLIWVAVILTVTYLSLREKSVSLEYLRRVDDPNIFYCENYPDLSCRVEIRGNNAIFLLSLPHELGRWKIWRFMSSHGLENFLVLPDEKYLIAFQKASDAHWDEVEFEILDFLFLHLYQKYRLKVNSALPIGAGWGYAERGGP